MSSARKIVVVGYPVGRVGSSAMMGLLQLAGVNVGRPERSAGPARMNPKGFFELQSQQQFLARAYPGIYPGISQPPPVSVLDEVGRTHQLAYRQLLTEEFGDQFPSAVKAPRMLILPCLHALRQEFDVRLLFMTRNREDQVHSLLRVWRSSPDPQKRAATPEFAHDWIHAWERFADLVRVHYAFPTLEVAFEDLLAQPFETMGRVARFLEIQPPEAQAVQRWLDPALVNRSRFSLAHLKSLIRSKLRQAARH